MQLTSRVKRQMSISKIFCSNFNITIRTFITRSQQIKNHRSLYCSSMPVQNCSEVIVTDQVTAFSGTWKLISDAVCLWPSTSSPWVAAGHQNSFTASTLRVIAPQCPVPCYMLWHKSLTTSLSLSLLCVQKVHHWMMMPCWFPVLFNMEAGQAWVHSHCSLRLMWAFRAVEESHSALRLLKHPEH